MTDDKDGAAQMTNPSDVELIERLEKLASGRLPTERDWTFTEVFDAALKLIRTLAAERDEQAQRVLAYKHSLLEAVAASNTAQSRLLKAVERLKPFAEEFTRRDRIKPGPDIDHWPIGGSALTYGDLRQAAELYALLQSIEAESGGEDNG